MPPAAQGSHQAAAGAGRTVAVSHQADVSERARKRLRVKSPRQPSVKRRSLPEAVAGASMACLQPGGAAAAPASAAADCSAALPTGSRWKHGDSAARPAEGPGMAARVDNVVTIDAERAAKILSGRKTMEARTAPPPSRCLGVYGIAVTGIPDLVVGRVSVSGCSPAMTGTLAP